LFIFKQMNADILKNSDYYTSRSASKYVWRIFCALSTRRVYRIRTSHRISSSYFPKHH
jgi:hypothetical protein